MMYPYITLRDDTEITHSEMKADGRVKVYIETPDEQDGFHHAVCWLPGYEWEDVQGYTESEMSYFRQQCGATVLLMNFEKKYEKYRFI